MKRSIGTLNLAGKHIIVSRPGTQRGIAVYGYTIYIYPKSPCAFLASGLLNTKMSITYRIGEGKLYEKNGNGKPLFICGDNEHLSLIVDGSDINVDYEIHYETVGI